MKRWIHADSNRATAYRADQQHKNNAGKRHQYAYDLSKVLSDQVADRIDNELFQDPQNNQLFSEYFDKYIDEYSQYHTLHSDESPNEWAESVRQDYGAICDILPASDCMRFHVYVFGPRGLESNHGLEWLADLQSGGDGNNRNIYVSKMPARMKRKMKEYMDIIAEYIEDTGLEILGPAKYDSDGFWYPVIDDGYKALL